MEKWTHTKDGRKVIRQFPTVDYDEMCSRIFPVSAIVEGIDRILSFTEEGKHYLTGCDSDYDLIKGSTNED